ncbi:hypothetical protein HDV06_001965 [Boothiomyces sp. JEL0866]|nr:hypothetical protein HDV06_001965 [Boothiomyces sp. JEL0866]
MAVVSETIDSDLIPVVDTPDGGYGNIQMALSFIIHTITFGIVSSFGVFQQYYKTIALFDNISTTGISIIGASAASGITLFGIIAGQFAEKYNYRAVSASGSIIMFAALWLASYSTTYVQLLMSQGVLFGFGAAFSYYPAISVLAHWFQRRLGFAAGFAATGSGIGGLIFGPAINRMLDLYGWENSLRYLGVIGGSITLLCALFIKERTHKTNKHTDSFLKFLSDVKFIGMALASVFSSFGFFVPFFFITLYAVQNGLTEQQGALILGLMNGASALGRLVLGYAADLLGCQNVLVGSLLVASLSTLLIWTFAHDFTTILIYSIIYGVCIGGYISVIPSGTASLFGKQNLSSKTACVFFGTSFGTFFGPILGAFMLDAFALKDNNVNFLPAIFMCGTALLVGALIQFGVRMYAAEGVLLKNI